MSATKLPQVKWVCPNGEHPAVLGSRRPMIEAMVRFCVPCSVRAGVLVRRVAPVLEAKRAKAAERQKAADRRNVERQRRAYEARHTVAGVDFLKALQVAWRLPTALELREKHRLPTYPPELHVRISEKYIVGALGYCFYGAYRIQVRTVRGTETCRQELLTLLHEVAHMLVQAHRRRLRPHGPEFQACLARLREQWDERADTHGMPRLGAPKADEAAVDTHNENEVTGEVVEISEPEPELPVPSSQPAVPEWDPEKPECPKCKGHGQVREQHPTTLELGESITCPACKGSGNAE